MGFGLWVLGYELGKDLEGLWFEKGAGDSTLCAD